MSVTYGKSNQDYFKWLTSGLSDGDVYVNTGPLPPAQGWWIQGPPIAAVADADPPEAAKTPLQEAEDYVSQFLNGAKCTITNHEPATTLHKLIMLKMLRLDMPHQSTNLKDLDLAIAKEAKK